MKSTNTSPLTDPLYKSTAITPSVLMAAIADTRGPLLSNRWYTGYWPRSAYPYFSTWSQWSEPVSSTPTEIFCYTSSPCHEFSPQSDTSLLCYFLNLFPGESMPCKQSTHSGCWDLPTGYMVLFSGRVPVNTYRGFPGPGPQYKSCQHRLGISSLSCWVGPVDSPHPSAQKA